MESMTSDGRNFHQNQRPTTSEYNGEFTKNKTIKIYENAS